MPISTRLPTSVRKCHMRGNNRYFGNIAQTNLSADFGQGIVVTIDYWPQNSSTTLFIAIAVTLSVVRKGWWKTALPLRLNVELSRRWSVAEAGRCYFGKVYWEHASNVNPILLPLSLVLPQQLWSFKDWPASKQLVNWPLTSHLWPILDADWQVCVPFALNNRIVCWAKSKLLSPASSEHTGALISKTENKTATT